MSRTISKTEQYRRLILRELLECNKRKMDRTTWHLRVEPKPEHCTPAGNATTLTHRPRSHSRTTPRLPGQHQRRPKTLALIHSLQTWTVETQKNQEKSVRRQIDAKSNTGNHFPVWRVDALLRLTNAQYNRWWKSTSSNCEHALTFFTLIQNFPTLAWFCATPGHGTQFCNVQRIPLIWNDVKSSKHTTYSKREYLYISWMILYQIEIENETILHANAFPYHKRL